MNTSWTVGILTFFFVLSYIDRVIMSMLVGQMKAQLGLTDFAISFLLGPALAVTYALSGMPFGWATDRYSRRTIIFLGVFIWSLSTAACGLLPTYYGVFLARMGVGIGISALIPPAYSLIADKIAKGRLATALSVFAMGPHIGVALTFAFGGVLIGIAGSLHETAGSLLSGFQPWQIVFLLVGTPGVFLAFLAFTIIEPLRARTPVSLRPERASILPFLRDHRLLLTLLLVGFASMTVIGGAVPIWVPSFMERHFHQTAAQFGPQLGLVTLIGTCTLPFAGLLIDRFYRRGVKDASVRCYTWLLAGFVPLGAVLFFAPYPGLFLAGYVVLFGVALSFMVFLSATIARICPPWLRGQITALFLLVAALIGLGVSPAIVAALTDFVFKDPQKLGYSLAIITGGGTLIALVCLRSSLRLVKTRIEENEASASD